MFPLLFSFFGIKAFVVVVVPFFFFLFASVTSALRQVAFAAINSVTSMLANSLGVVLVAARLFLLNIFC